MSAEATIAELDQIAADALEIAPASEPLSHNSLSSHQLPWPDPLDAAALRGIVGQVVEAAIGHGEADPAAVLISFLTAFGSAVGSEPHCLVGATRHGTNLFAVAVGKSAKARKGDSWSPVRAIMDLADPVWSRERVLQGLSSGEGLIAAVRDPNFVTKDGEQVMIDAGVEDKRLLAMAPEFARILAVMQRDGSTLSAVLREGWDSGNLRVLTKSPTVATGAHVSILAHVTADELRRELTTTDAASGFANRFLWIAVKRGRMMADPTAFIGDAVQKVADPVRACLEFARSVGLVQRDPEASELWRELYPDLSRERPGLAGAVLSRHEAQAVRLSLLYALLDRSQVIGTDHLESAVAVLDYVAESARVIFGDALGDAVADAIVGKLSLAPEGLTRTEISGAFGRHLSAARLEVALSALHDAGRAVMRSVPGEDGGRPAEVWSMASPRERSERSERTGAGGGDLSHNSLASHPGAPR